MKWGRRLYELDFGCGLRDDDLLIMSRCDGDLSSSYAVTYSALREYVKGGILDNLGFGSMAYENKYDYSRNDHVHGYTRFEYVPTCVSGEILGKIRVLDGEQTGELSVYREKDVAQPPLVYPKAGEIRYVFSNRRFNSTLEDINDTGFDGWILANGLCVDWDDVTNPNVLEYRETSPFTTQDGFLKIPLLSNFMKVVPHPSGKFADGEIPFKNTIPVHHHDISSAVVKMTCKMDKSDKFVKTADKGSWKSEKFASGVKEKQLSVATCHNSKRVSLDSLRFDIGMGGVTQEVETYPTHNRIPTLVYILGGYDGDLHVTFLDHDMTLIRVVGVKIGESAVPPPNPQRTGYTFTGWDRDFTHVRSDLTCIAKYDVNKYTITLDDMGGTGGQGSVVATYGQKIPDLTKIPSPPKTQTDKFSGYFTKPAGGIQYYDSEGKGLVEYYTAGDMTLSAIYGDVPTDLYDSYNDETNHFGQSKKTFIPGRYKVVAVGAGALTSNYKTEDVWKEDSGTIFSKHAHEDQARNTAYKFAITAGIAYSPYTQSNGKSRVWYYGGGYAGWTGKSMGYWVSVFHQFKTQSAAYYSVAGGSGACMIGDLDIPNIYKTTITTSDSAITNIKFEDTTVIARCAINQNGGNAAQCSPRNGFTITSGNNGQTGENVSQYPSVDGGNFASNTYKYGGGQGHDGMSYEPIYGYARIERYMEVTFWSDGKDYDQKRYCLRGQKVTKPANPTKTGYTFTGWNPDINEPITKDITLSAVFEENT